MSRTAISTLTEQLGRPRSGPVLRTALGVATAFGGWWLLDQFLPRGLPAGIVLLGAVYGSLYALTAIGLVLVYQANRVVNFAQAELGAVAAVLAIELRIQFHWNYFLAAAVGLVAAVAIGALVDLTVIRRFRHAPRLILAVATIGVAQILNGLSVQIPLWFTGGATGFHATPFKSPFEASFNLRPVVFSGDHVVAIVGAAIALVALVAFLRLTDYGVGIRASAENGERANLLGIPVFRLSTIVWALAALLSAITVILRIPLVGFVSFTSVSGGGSSLLLRTLAAAVIGRMQNLTVTAVAAIGLGIVQEGTFWTYANGTYVDGILVIVILVALLAQRGAFTRSAETGIATWRAMREVRPIPAELRGLPEVRWGLTTMRLVLVAAAVTLPLWTSSSRQELAGLVLIYAIIAVSLVVLTGWAGQISLGHFALTGFGGATVSVLVSRHDWDYFLALPAGMVVAGTVALLIGLPALRVTGPFLAVTTLAFAVTSFTFLLEDRYFPWFVEPQMMRPVLWERFAFDRDWKVYYLCLISLVLVIAAVRSLRLSRTGRAIVAARDNELAAQAVSLNTTRLKLTAFVVSGALAGLAGGLYVLHQRGLKSDAFGPEVSIRLFSMVVIGGLGSIPGAILGAIYIRGAEFFLPTGLALFASGFGLLLLLMVLPGGLGEGLYRIRDDLLRRVAARRGIIVPSLVADVKVTDASEAPEALGSALTGLAATTSANGDSDARGVDRGDAHASTVGNRR